MNLSEISKLATEPPTAFPRLSEHGLLVACKQSGSGRETGRLARDAYLMTMSVWIVR